MTRLVVGDDALPAAAGVDGRLSHCWIIFRVAPLLADLTGDRASV